MPSSRTWKRRAGSTRISSPLLRSGALLLAITGIYAVVAFSVSLRTQEIAIRMALGAQRNRIARLVLISGAKMALLGCGLGVLGSLAISRMVSSFLFNVSATDPLVYLAAVVTMMLMALAASALPAMRAASARSDRCFAVELRIGSPGGISLPTLPIPLVMGKVESVPAWRARISVTTTANHPVSQLESLGLVTANDVFFRLVEFDCAEALLQQDAAGFWHPISARDVYARVKSLADVLRGWGIAKGDRIAILSENRWEWAVMDFAVLAIGAVDVPIYPTQTAEQTAVLLADSGSRIAFVSTREQYEKVASVRGQTRLERVVLMDSFAADAVVDAIAFSSLMPGRERAAQSSSGMQSLIGGRCKYSRKIWRRLFTPRERRASQRA